ncbi:ATP-binding protein [Asticcacaulis sp. BYS171W]|uniref:histidine kinase n=1 Tax=Asticcacaulis aquaticus TaxID=2984212 RepID=A0ABT5HQD6_9CAUL|nr:ATP-binding protein [Asticcacaulis aquaticus]MDC7682259.1 ATP-binding protein [Asticcacaulis aquaticus]
MRSYLAAIVASSDDAIIGKTLDGIITAWNDSAHRIFGYTAEEAIGQHITLIIPHDKRDEETHIIGQVRRGERIDHFETIRVGKFGQLVHLSLTVSPIRDSTGRVIGASKVARDISQQKATEALLAEVGRRREEFMANMSHELRTPMNAVIGLTHILAMSDNLTPKQQEYIAVLKQSGDNLLGLINNLLDFSRLENGAMELEINDFNLPELIEHTVGPQRLSATQKGVALNVSLSGPVREFYRGDALRLQQILTNLVSNALKFTESGSVDLRVTAVDVGANASRLLFEVIDTGIGISDEVLPLIFDKFIQADASMTRRYGGSGLGLSISQAIARQMGGLIRVKSTLGLGSSFSVDLLIQHDPLRAALARRPDVSVVRAHRNALVVDDYEPNILVVTTLLDRLGFGYDVARNGMEAVRRSEQCDYDVILMDVQMPGMDGYESTRRIREIEDMRGLRPTPIIAMTAHVGDSDRQKCYDAGMTGFIPKPFEPTQFQTLLGDLIRPTIPQAL